MRKGKCYENAINRVASLFKRRLHLRALFQHRATLAELVNKLEEELKAKGVTVTFTETLLPEEAMAQSNLILLNGVPLEDVLEDTTASENTCQSCSCLTGKDTSCRTVEHEGVIYEDIPAGLIRRAAYRADGIME